MNTVNYTPKEEDLKEWGKPIVDSLLGFTKLDIEPLFERFVLPIYRFAASYPEEDTKWKIVDRETGEEYSKERAIKEVEQFYT